ncbi:MAG TPA: medium chain dehydrogenase/reductase family protein [Acidimicrobiales bacterium]|nr:medium chain dehydrogenase/reductase family protein [Acidimicrobiales bacterium]
MEEPRRLRERELPFPELTADTGLLRVEACGLCGTDHEQFTGHLPAGFSFVPGHEIVGTVEEIGSAAADRWGVQAGDRVAVEVFQSCRDCQPCRAGEYRRCEHHGLADMFGFIDVNRAPGLWGGYATHLHLAPDTLLLPVPAELDPVVATLFNPLGAGIRWGVEVPDTQPGEVVVVLGPGIRGLCAASAAKQAGAGFVMVTGLGARDRGRLGLAREFGADLAIDVAEADPAVALRDATGALADVVVDVTAKAPAALAQAVSLATPGGRIVLAGTRGSTDTPGFVPDMIVYKELRIIGALGVDAPAYRQAFDLLAKATHPFADLPRRVEPLDAGRVSSLLSTMAGEGDSEPPVHAVVVP